MNHAHHTRSLIALAATAVLLAGCGGPSLASSGATHGGSSNALQISDFKFKPASLSVNTGGIVVTNADGVAHSVTADDGRSFDSGILGPGTSRTIAVSEPGRYPYHCVVHPFMHGTVVAR